MTAALRTAMTQMLAVRLASLGVMVVAFAVLSRLIEPAQFGYFAIAMSIYTVMRTVAAFGLRQFIIRAEHAVDRDMLRHAAGLSFLIAIGCSAALLITGTAFDDKVPAPLAAALIPLGLALLLEPFSLATEAQLHRDLRFALPAKVAAAQTVIDSAVSVALATLGLGAAALATGVLVAQIATTGMLLWWGGAEGRIWPKPMLSGLGNLTRFGRRYTWVEIAPQLTDMLLIAMLAALASPGVAGLFNRAQVIHKLLDRTLFEGITPVVLPAISNALAQGVPPASVHFTKVDLLAAICWPGFATMAILAEPLVAVLIGQQWQAAVVPVQILALMGSAYPLTKMSSKFFAAADELRFFARVQLVHQVTRLVFGAAGAMVSLNAFCAALALSAGLKSIYLAVWVSRRFGASHYRNLLTRAAMLTLATVLGPALIMAGDFTALVTLALSLPLAAISWIMALRLLRHPLWGQAIETLGLLRRGMRGAA